MTAQSDTNSSSAPRTKLPLNEIRRADGGERQAPSQAIPEDLRSHYHQDKNAFRSAHRAEKIEFVDRGNRMHAYRPASTFTVRALVRIAEARGWTALEMTGDKAFQSRAYIEAASRGMDVKGYQATDKDQEILQRRLDRKAAAGDPKVQAFVKAQDDKAIKAAVKKHPELKEFFAARAVVAKTAAGIEDDKGRENFLGAMNDRLAIAVYRGEKPEVQLRTEPSKSKSAESAGQER